ncbi:hypothetical protein [Bordetella sp. 2513F-2]
MSDVLSAAVAPVSRPVPKSLMRKLKLHVSGFADAVAEVRRGMEAARQHRCVMPARRPH